VFAVVLAVLFVSLYNVQTGHQDHAVGGSQVWYVNAELVSPSSNLGQRYTVLLRVVLLYYCILILFFFVYCYCTFGYNSLVFADCVCSHHW